MGKGRCIFLEQKPRESLDENYATRRLGDKFHAVQTGQPTFVSSFHQAKSWNRAEADGV